MPGNQKICNCLDSLFTGRIVALSQVSAGQRFGKSGRPDFCHGIMTRHKWQVLHDVLIFDGAKSCFCALRKMTTGEFDTAATNTTFEMYGWDALVELE